MSGVPDSQTGGAARTHLFRGPRRHARSQPRDAVAVRLRPTAWGSGYHTVVTTAAGCVAFSPTSAPPHFPVVTRQHAPRNPTPRSVRLRPPSRPGGPSRERRLRVGRAPRPPHRHGGLQLSLDGPSMVPRWSLGGPPARWCLLPAAAAPAAARPGGGARCPRRGAAPLTRLPAATNRPPPPPTGRPSAAAAVATAAFAAVAGVVVPRPPARASRRPRRRPPPPPTAAPDLSALRHGGGGRAPPADGAIVVGTGKNNSQPKQTQRLEPGGVITI